MWLLSRAHRTCDFLCFPGSVHGSVGFPGASSPAPPPPDNPSANPQERPRPQPPSRLIPGRQGPSPQPSVANSQHSHQREHVRLQASKGFPSQKKAEDLSVGARSEPSSKRLLLASDRSSPHSSHTGLLLCCTLRTGPPRVLCTCRPLPSNLSPRLSLPSSAESRLQRGLPLPHGHRSLYSASPS